MALSPSQCAALAVAAFLAQAGSAGADPWVSETQPSAPEADLCTALVERLNSFPLSCALESHPDFSSPPWKVLDGRQHLDLIASLLLSQLPGPGEQNATPVQWERARAGARDFVERGNTIQVWQTHLLSNFDDTRGPPAPPGPQMVVQLIWKQGDPRPLQACAWGNMQEWVRMTFLVKADMTGPDPRVGTGTAYALQTHPPMLYKDKVLLIGKTDVFRDIPGIGLRGGLCLFEQKPEGQKQ